MREAKNSFSTLILVIRNICNSKNRDRNNNFLYDAL